MLDTRTRLHAARLGEHLTSIDPSTQWQLAGMRAIAGFRSPDADGAAYYLLNMKVSHVSLAWAFQDCFCAHVGVHALLPFTATAEISH